MSAGTLPPAAMDTAANPFAREPEYQLVTHAFDFEDGAEGEPFDEDDGVVQSQGFVVERIEDHQRLSWQTLPKGDGLESVPVAGASHRLAHLQDQSFAPGQPLALVPEPTNPYDPQAIAVWNEARTLHIGYLPRATAAELAKDTSPEPLGCLSMWEYRKHGQRVGLRVLLVWGRARLRGARFFRRATSSPDPRPSA